MDVESRLRSLEKQIEILKHNSYSLFAGQQLSTWGMSVRHISASQDLSSSDMFVLVDASAGEVTVTLPPALGALNQVFFIKKIDASTNAVTVSCRGAETIDGVAAYTLAARYETVAVASDGTNWYIFNRFGLFRGIMIYEHRTPPQGQGGPMEPDVWTLRPLTHEVIDTHGNGTLSSNRITLVPGTYWFRAISLVHGGTGHQLRVLNVSDGTLITGTTSRAITDTQTESSVETVFTITTSKTFELQHYSRSGNRANGLGAATGMVHNTFARVVIVRLA